MKKTLFVSALAFLSISVTAQADPFYDDRRAHLDVPSADLNLSHPAGAAIMLNRINFAARRLCGGLPDIREIRERMLFKACVAEAASDAVEDLNMPLVSTLHRQERAKEEQLAAARN